MSDLLYDNDSPPAAGWVAPLRAWLAAGGPPAACPDPRLRGLPATEPGEPITLTADEASQLSRLLGRSVSWQPLLGGDRDIPGARESLLARGVLELVDGVEVISRDAFPTVGVALLGQRTTIVSGMTDLGARNCRQLAYVRSPGRTVRIRTPDERSYVIEPATLAEIPAGLEAEFGLDHYPGIDPPIIDPRTFELVDGEHPPSELAHLFDRDEAYRRLDWTIEDAFVAADGSSARVTSLLLAAPDGLWLEERVPKYRGMYRRISVRDAFLELGVLVLSPPLVGAYLWARWRITHAPQQTHFTVRPPGEQDARRR